MLPVVESHIYGSKFLDAGELSVDPISCSLGESRVEIDELDRRVLGALSSSKSGAVGARALGIPSATFDYRVKRLEQLGVILRHLYWVQPHKFGMFPFLLLISSPSRSEKFEQKFETFCRAAVAIDDIARTLGCWDYLVEVQAASFEEATSVSEAMFEKFESEIRTIKVLPLHRIHENPSFCY